MYLQEGLFLNMLKNNEIILNTLLIRVCYYTRVFYTMGEHSRWFAAVTWYKCVDFCMCVSN